MLLSDRKPKANKVEFVISCLSVPVANHNYIDSSVNTLKLKCTEVLITSFCVKLNCLKALVMNSGMTILGMGGWG